MSTKTITTKYCPRCKSDVAEFVGSYCKPCNASWKKERRNAPEFKYCKRCEKDVSKHNWYKRSPFCQPCTKQYRKENPTWRAYHLNAKFGITPEQYDAMWKAQNGLCAICNNPEGARKLDVDHDHETGKVRALLCNACNQGIGYLKDNPQIISAAAEYLRGYA